MIELLQFGFVQRALVAGVFVALGCGLLGVFLVLRRYAMIGDGLSHFAFGAVGLALLLGWTPLYVALPLVALASLVILYLPDRAALYGDSAIGMISAVGIAAGVLLSSLGGGFNVDLFSFLFGDILSVSRAEARLAVGLAFGVIGMIALFYQELFAVTFDETAARVAGIRTSRINRLLALLTALMVVLGIRVVGTMLVSSLLIFPAVTALQFRRGFKGTLALSAALGTLSVVLGLSLSLLLDTPAGAMIVLVNAALFLAACALAGRSRNP
ncbi:MAG: metal ABC transporter permease [Kiritimatiellae bacterium]|nr:metal ABC transporter permease [Kiritimatiellia bacterium]